MPDEMKTNLKTPAEARETHCPNARVADWDTDKGLPISGYNRVAGIGLSVESNCIADKCMAWRWTSHVRPSSGGSKQIGYCGAFGSPRS